MRSWELSSKTNGASGPGANDATPRSVAPHKTAMTSWAFARFQPLFSTLCIYKCKHLQYIGTTYTLILRMRRLRQEKTICPKLHQLGSKKWISNSSTELFCISEQCVPCINVPGREGWMVLKSSQALQGALCLPTGTAQKGPLFLSAWCPV